jgi:hypothetical protein
MKLRRNQLIAIVVTMVDDDDVLRMAKRYLETSPIIVPGGPYAEHNVQVILQSVQFNNPDAKWSARIVYRWRSKRHLMRQVRQQGWRRSERHDEGRYISSQGDKDSEGQA